VLPMAPMPMAPGGDASAMNASMPATSAPPNWGAPITAQRAAARDATPTARDSFDQPVFPRQSSMPQVAGFNRARKQGVKPWVLVVGALIMALLAFAITRAFIG
jgi:hypothetical protein